MLQLKNHSPLAAAMAVFPDPGGVDTLYVTVKATFRFGERPDSPLLLAEKQIAPFGADVYWGEPGASSLRYAAEIHPCKPGTDVALVGSAHAPEGELVTQVDVMLSIAERSKILRVFGDRQWKRGLIDIYPGKPAPFSRMPLTWERSFGGVHLDNPKKPQGMRTNPVGIGFKGGRSVNEMVGTPAPNIEDPMQPIKSLGDRYVPQGFGFIPPTWEPRVRYAGTYDEAWEKNRAPYLPADFDTRFFHAASPDLVFETALQGGETVQIVNACHGGVRKFDLPALTPECRVEIDGAIERPTFQLETVLLEPDEDRVCMLFRSALPCDKRALLIGRVDIECPAMDASFGAPT